MKEKTIAGHRVFRTAPHQTTSSRNVIISNRELRVKGELLVLILTVSGVWSCSKYILTRVVRTPRLQFVSLVSHFPHGTASE